MTRHKIFLLIVAISVALVYFFQQDVLGREREKNLGDSKPKNIAKIIRPSDVSNIDLRKIKRTTVLITSTSPLFGGVAEDHLAIKLRDKGFDVVEKSKIYELILKESKKKKFKKLEEQLELEKQLEKEGDTSRELKRLEKQLLEKVGEKSQKDILNIISIGEKLGLDAVIIGTLFEGKHQISFLKDKPPQFMEKIVVSTFYLQVIDVQTEKVVLAIILEYDKGENVANVIDIMTKIIIDEIKD